MTIWKTDYSGFTATAVYQNSCESRLITSIPPEDTILPADPLTAAEQRAVIQEQIDNLERQQLLPRVAREGLLNTFVILAAGQGVSEPQLYIDNIAYKKTKDFDGVITALRTAMEAIV